MNKKIKKAIDNLQDFLECDMPSKIFPQETFNKQRWVRTDYFRTRKDVEQYIEDHFKVLWNEINGEGCDCVMTIRGSGDPCPKCKQEKKDETKD